MVDMVQHQAGCLVDVLFLERLKDVQMLVVAAARYAAAPVKGDHQRRASHQLVHEFLEDRVAGDLGQQQMEVAGCLDLGSTRLRAALVAMAVFFLQLLPEGIYVLPGDAFRCGGHDAGLDQAT
ncbi:hypothetical protein D3C87_1867120 [compost metagenome]